MVNEETVHVTVGADDSTHTMTPLLMVNVRETNEAVKTECESGMAITAPTAGTLTYAATVSLLVSIFKPVEPPALAVTAALAARLRPVHVTVTAPAARLDVAPRVIVMASELYIAVPAAVVGDEMAQPEPAVTSPAGKVSVTLLSVA